MKAILSLIIVSCLFVSCDVLEQIEYPNLSSGVELSESEIRAGLTEALEVGLKNAVSQASVKDGFYKNDKIFIPFPMEAYKVREAALNFHLDSQVEKFEETLNRAAEQAVTEVKPIFLKALKEMSYSDAKSILKGNDNAATKYFKNKTYEELVKTCYPKIEAVTSDVKLTSYWSPIVKVYNKARILTGDPEINPDLNAYVTEKTIDGLFVLVEQEELKIRTNPQKRVTELLKKVFGSL
jgi:hypothetical protein